MNFFHLTLEFMIKRVIRTYDAGVNNRVHIFDELLLTGHLVSGKDRTGSNLLYFRKRRNRSAFSEKPGINGG
jgi:hypothetical protein